MVVGGQAVLIYGEPRLTNDIDITLGVNTDKFEEVFSIAKELKLTVLVKDALQFVRRNSVLPLKDKQSGFRIDLIFSFTDFEMNAIIRAKSIIFGKKKIKFASVEDLIILKMFAGRPRDIEDVMNIIKKNKKLDRIYIRKWLKIFDKSNNGTLLQQFKKFTLSI